MMKIDFAAEITDVTGAPVKENDEIVTLGRLAMDALMATLVIDGRAEQLDGKTKVRNAVLATTIYSAKEPLDVKAEDIVLIKDRIGKAFSPLAVMRAWELLDGSEVLSVTG